MYRLSFDEGTTLKKFKTTQTAETIVSAFTFCLLKKALLLYIENTIEEPRRCRETKSLIVLWRCIKV